MSIQKMTFGTPEAMVPTAFCPEFRGRELPEADGAARAEITFRASAKGCTLELPFSESEEYYGFGLQLHSFSHKNRKLTLRVNSDPLFSTGDSHAPVPFFVSTAGYGIYVDTARYAEFYVGVQRVTSATTQGQTHGGNSVEELYAVRQSGDEKVIVIHIPAAQGVTLYRIDGKNILDVVKQYNLLAGGGPEIPDWGLGTYYRCHLDADADSVMKTASYLTEKGMPCDVIGLEPHWQTRSYSCSYVWSEKFPTEKRAELERCLAEKGMHLNLWQHAFVHPESPLYEALGEGCGSYKVWGGKVPDFTVEKTVETFAEYQNRTLVSDVTDGFKLDECDGSDYTRDWSFPNCAEFPGGLDGEQYHTLFGMLYARAAIRALDGRPTYGQCRNMGALATSLPFALYSDLYGHKEFIRGCVNSGFSGLLWAPELRHGDSREDLLRRLQTAVFSAQCMFNGWYCTEAPWINLGCEEEVRELFRIRESLKPMLREAYDRYRAEGIPPVRALVCDYTEDRATWTIDDEYLFCESLLVAPMTAEETSRRVYLPAGEWEDFFTGEAVESGWLEYSGSGIPVYRKRK
ncbi:MAG: glycoside hydrolase [Ruminococcaceae bacterium]|nr:glycoside hydrolase [Oscillospiraceae bacterium]